MFSSFFRQVYTERQIHMFEKTLIASVFGEDQGGVCDDCHISLKSGA